MKSSALVIIAIGMMFLGAGIAITFQYLTLPGCCTCPPTSFKFQTFYTWLTKINTPLNCSTACEPFGECAKSYYIIPSDIFALSLIFIGTGAVIHFNKFKPPNLTKILKK